MSGELTRLCGVDEVEEGGTRRVSIVGRTDVAVFKVGGHIYVTDDLCTHSTASLSDDGILEGYVIECTWHQGKFDVRTGAVLAPPCIKALRTYSVTVIDGGVYVPASALAVLE